MADGLWSRVKRSFVLPAAERRNFVSPYGYESPAYSILINGMFGQPPSRGTGFTARAEALEIPAVLRGRNLICSISTLPLEAVDQRNVVQRHPLLEQIDPNVANVVTIAQLVEDLLFDAVAWLKITATDAAGYPTKAIRIDPTQVSFTPPSDYKRGWLPSDLPTTGVIWMNGDPVAWDRVIRFDSPNPPLMKVIRRVVARAIALDAAAAMYAENPRPSDYFEPADPTADPVDDEIIQKILDQWKEARRERSTAYVPAALKYNTVQQPTPVELQLAQLQKQVGLEIANALGLDPEDLGLSTTSRTYQNATDRRKDRINDTLSSYMGAITGRLTMPDVTKRGIRTRFSLDDYLRADPKTRAEVNAIYIEKRVVTPEWVAATEGLPPEALPKAYETPTAIEPDRPIINVGEATVAEPLAIAANERAQYRFAAAQHELTFENPAVTAAFAVDIPHRTISGLIVPWGQHARSGGRSWRFARGGLAPIADLKRVKLLRDHDNSQALGYALSIEETDAGLVGTFTVAPGPDGDRALALAEHGTLDGLSIGADWTPDAFSPDPENPGVSLVHRYSMKETSLTAMPAFPDSRLTSVRASDQGEKESGMPEPTPQATAPETTPTPAPAPNIAPAPAPAAAPAAPAAPVVTFSAEQFTEFMNVHRGNTQVADGQVAPAVAPAQPEARPVVNPTGEVGTGEAGAQGAVFVAEPLPYRFSYERPFEGRPGRHVFHTGAQFDFSTDLYNAINKRSGVDLDGAVKRVNDLVRRTFAVSVSNVSSVTPNKDRPDLWVPQMDYTTPLWDMVNAGTLADGTPFDVPKFSSASGLVSAATAGTEPSPGAFAVTTQTITPTQLWGKVEIERQAIRRGGNPQISGIIWDQMLRSYVEARESAVATFLNTLTAATDITLTVATGASDATEDRASVADLEAALADLQFARGGNRFSAAAAQQDLFRLLARVADTAGRRLFPMINPQNANGTTRALYATIDVGGTVFVPAWALGAAGQTNPTNSWLFDPAKVLGWASEPDRLDWDFGATVQSNNVTQLAYVTMGIYGDVALANTDINGVRQIVHDPVGS